MWITMAWETCIGTIWYFDFKNISRQVHQDDSKFESDREPVSVSGPVTTASCQCAEITTHTAGLISGVCGIISETCGESTHINIYNLSSLTIFHSLLDSLC